MDCFVEEILEWSPLTADDLPEVAELRTAVEYFDDPVARVGLAELVAAFERPSAEPESNAVVGRDSRNNLVAYGWNLLEDVRPVPRVVLDGAVHPAWRDQRIGHSLAGWQIARAKEWAGGFEDVSHVWVGVYTDNSATGAQRLFMAHGLAPERYFFDMHHFFSRVPNPPPPPPVAGVEFVRYHSQASEDVRKLHNECFANNVGFNPVMPATWERMQHRQEFRPDWSWLAYADGRLIGYALSSADEEAWAVQGCTEGWTDRLGVHPDYRRRGVAKGLLSWSMWSFGRAGLEGAGLGVDTNDATSALALYESIGYEFQEMVVLLATTVAVRD